MIELKGIVLAALLLSVAPAAAQTVTPPGDTLVASGEVVAVEDGELRIEVVARDLVLPSALAFLPDGRALLAERMAGRLSLLDPAPRARTPGVGGAPGHPAGTRGFGGGLGAVHGPPAKPPDRGV